MNFKKDFSSIVIFLTLISLLISSGIFYTNFRKLEDIENEVLEISKKRNQLTKLYNEELKTIKAKRGYQFSRFDWELNNYNKSKENTLAQLDSVKKHFQEMDNRWKIDSLESTIQKRLTQFDQHISLLQSTELSKAELRILTEEEKMRRDSERVDALFKSLYTNLDEDIEQKKKAAALLEKQNKWGFAVLIFTAFILLGLIIYSIDRRIKREKEEQRKELMYSATKESEDVFSSSFEYAPIGMALVSKEGNWMKVNKTLCSIMGYSAHELMQKSFHEVTYDKDLKEDLLFLDQLIRGEINSYQLEKRYIHKNGAIIWAILGVSAIRNEDQSIKFFVSQIQDISQRKIAQKRLLKEKYRVSNILEGTNAGTWEWNVQTGKTIFNEKWANLIGYSLDELQPVNIDTWMSFVHPDDLEHSNQKLKDCFSGKTSYYEAEVRMKHKAGHWVWILDRGKVISWTKNGKPIWMFGTHIDITEIKEANFALQQSEERFKGIFNSAFQLMGFLDVDGTLLEANETALEFGGLKIEDVAGKKVWDTFWWTISIEVQDQLKEAVFKAASGETIKYEVAVWDKNKIPTTILFNLKPLINHNLNKVEAIIAEGRPVQDIVDARNALLSKNEELKSFATVAAHDLKEPLRTITSFLNLLKTKYDKVLDEKGIQFINHSVDAADRMNNLIVDLLEHAKIGTDEVEFEKINIQKLMGEVLAYNESSILEKNAKIIYEDLPDIAGQKTTIRLLFQNLVSNALKYQNQDHPPLIEIRAKQRGNFQEFEITDNGIGIDPQYHERIFLMFRRLHTRKEYPGTGMGLATCKKIVLQHGGDMWIKSQLGKGSAFYFTLPKA